MQRHPKHASSRRWKRLFYLFALPLIAVAISLCVLKPLELWERGASTTPPPPTPSATERFTTLPPGAILPSEADCASRVRRSPWEPRPDNLAANHRVPTNQQISNMEPWSPANGLDPKADTFRKQITGNFTGITDEIFQWVACKWGIDEDIIRAEAVAESHWYQSQLGDWTTDSSLCPPNTWHGTGCYQSYGILQVKYIYNRTAWPMSRDDTAFNAEYAYGLIRICYEGLAIYLSDHTPLSGYSRYHAGDIWGCVGRWYSGYWYDQDAIDYINKVKTILENKKWLQPRF